MNDDIDKELMEDEAESIRSRLDTMGVKYHPNTGVERLREKLKTALGDTPTEPESKAKGGQISTKEYRKREAMRMVRIIVHNNDPNKREYEGEYFTVGNPELGVITKFVPFGNTEGWHVPKVIYDEIKHAKVQLFRSKKIAGGLETSEGYITNAYNVEVLDPLTKEEMDKLAMEQKARNAIGDN